MAPPSIFKIRCIHPFCLGYVINKSRRLPHPLILATIGAVGFVEYVRISYAHECHGFNVLITPRQPRKVVVCPVWPLCPPINTWLNQIRHQSLIIGYPVLQSLYVGQPRNKHEIPNANKRNKMVVKANCHPNGP